MDYKMTDTFDIYNFLYAGKATFTVKSLTSGNHWTFKARRKKDDTTIFISLLCGADDYQYLGYLKLNVEKTYDYKTSKKSCRGLDNVAHIVIKTLINYIDRGELHPKFEFYHEGVCGRCGKSLTDPESIKRGLGPTCATLV